MNNDLDAIEECLEENDSKWNQAVDATAETTHTDTLAQTVDPAGEVEDLNIVRQKIVNEEYKVWKKHAPFLYDIMMRYAILDEN